MWDDGDGGCRENTMAWTHHGEDVRGKDAGTEGSQDEGCGRAAVRGNTTRENNYPPICVSPKEGLKKKRSCPAASGCGKSWASAAIGDILFSGRTVIGGGGGGGCGGR